MLCMRLSRSAAVSLAAGPLLLAAALLSACGGDSADAEQQTPAPQTQQQTPAATRSSTTTQAPSSSNPSAGSSTTTATAQTTSASGSGSTAAASTAAGSEEEDGAAAQSETASADDGGGETEAGAEEGEPAEASEPIPYVVKGGDTLAQIAREFSVDVNRLAEFNGLRDPDLLSVGQLLYIPTGAAALPRAGGSATLGSADPASLIPVGIELPRPAIAWATPIVTRSSQFPQPPVALALEAIPARPRNFLDYGAHALPWLQGKSTVPEIADLYRAWPMPANPERPDRIYLIDANANGQSSIALIFNNPNAFASERPPANLVVYDRAPGPGLRYRIAYDHALAYGREPGDLAFIANEDLTGDDRRDLSFRETSCDRNGCTSVFHVLISWGAGYRVVTGPQAIVGDVSEISIRDATGDGTPDIVVTGDPPGPLDGPHQLILTADQERLIQHGRPTPR